MVKKHISLDDLAGMVKRGFDGVDKRFDQIDKRFEQVDKRLGSIELKIAHLEARVSMIERDIAEIRKGLISKIDFEDLMSRVKYLELKIGIKSGK